MSDSCWRGTSRIGINLKRLARMQRTALYDLHVELGARMVDFAGWEMPLVYSSIVDEHLHTRKACSVFDVSHMGRLRLGGADAARLIQQVCTRNIEDQASGQSRYSHICKADGGILDDVIVSRYENDWGIVCNASNRPKIVDWLKQHADGRDVKLVDETADTIMVAIQGPCAMKLLAERVPLPIADLKRYRFITADLFGMAVSVFRSGYTGEDGVEVIAPASTAPFLRQLLDDDDPASAKLKPAGLGARDTLRLEAAMPLYGHELNEDIDSISAGQGWCVDLDKDFIGVQAMRRVHDGAVRQVLIGLELDGKRTARQHYDVLADGKRVGEVTSGALSPTLGKSIAMAFVAPEHAEADGRLQVDFKGKPVDATVVRLPFYKRPRK